MTPAFRAQPRRVKDERVTPRRSDLYFNLQVTLLPVTILVRDRANLFFLNFSKWPVGTGVFLMPF